jgi:penicillin-binding protein 1B
MDLAAAELQRLMENEVAYPGALNVSATIDLRLQKAAEQAVTDGMAQVDKLLAKHRDAKGNMDHAQAAMIALDPHTGEILAVVGGRDYGTSQLDRVLSKRPPGSVFKPFVYAAALNSAVDGDGPVLTPASTVDDVPTTFYYDGQTYNPGNFKEEFHGTVTFREALAKSMNVAAVKVGEMIGFDQVVALAREAGMNDDLRPTPALALGAYQVTPLEIARAYTVFANSGMLVQPSPIRSVTAQDGTEIVHNSPETRRVLDERVNFLIVDMMQDVLKYGTAAGVRSRGFTLPAAGKTGTSHDGWFAGFTSNLLCVVWVGFDDYDELGLEGARSALPIWTEFMKSAARYKAYRDAKPFPVPDGITRAAIDPSTGMLATPFCPWNVTDYFVSGTEPKDMCMQHQDEAAPQMAPDPNSINVPAITSLMPSAAPAAPPAQ